MSFVLSMREEIWMIFYGSWIFDFKQINEILLSESCN